MSNALNGQTTRTALVGTVIICDKQALLKTRLDGCTPSFYRFVK